MKKEIISFKNIYYIRDNKNILKEINWTINSDERWVLLGLNGSGKTTLLSMIPSYTFPSRGDLKVFSKEFGKYNWENIRRKISFISSSLNRFESTWSMSGILDIIISGKYSSIGIYEKRDEFTELEEIKRAKSIINNFELNYILERKSYFYQLSQGEKRRVLLARSFMAESKLIIFDEPCESLDIRAREKILSSLEKEAKNKEYIYTTHDISEIIPSVTHVAILENGTITKKGFKEDIINSKNLSLLYGIEIEIKWKRQRPFIIIK